MVVRWSTSPAATPCTYGTSSCLMSNRWTIAAAVRPSIQTFDVPYTVLRFMVLFLLSSPCPTLASGDSVDGDSRLVTRVVSYTPADVSIEPHRSRVRVKIILYTPHYGVSRRSL